MEIKYLNINGEWVVSTSIYKKRILTIELIHSVLRLLEERYGYTEIRESDFIRIANNADFLVRSYQVVSVEDIDLGATYECLNDTKVADELPVTEPQQKQSNQKESKKR